MKLYSSKYTIFSQNKITPQLTGVLFLNKKVFDGAAVHARLRPDAVDGSSIFVAIARIIRNLAGVAEWFFVPLLSWRGEMS